jgi:signal transduction histidine kinase
LARSRTSYRQVPAVRDVLHEARNALGAILACAEFLAAHPRLAADLAEATEILRRECLRLDHLAWEILVAGRPGSGPCAG